MKNFLTLTLVLFLSLFIVEESKGEVSNVILGCEIVATNGYQHTGYFKYRYKTFFEIKGGLSPTAISYGYFEKNTDNPRKVDPYTKNYYNIVEDISMLTLINSKLPAGYVYSRYFIDRETLIGRTEGFTDSYDQCEILPSTKTVMQYVDMHMKSFEDFLETERNEQLRKNKI